MHKPKCVLFACETLLRWLVMRNMPPETIDCLLINMTTSLLKKNTSIANLWEIDILGIKDPFKTKYKEELETMALEYFRKPIFN